MADEQRNWFLFMVLFSCLVYSSYSYQFVVGGKDGWVVKPSENYNQWASRMRFQVNDTILFKYKSGSDSVLVVNKGDYDSCTVANPLLKLDDGNSVFKFNRSGPFYFISGNKANCDQGQKLIVVVLALRSPPAGNGGAPGSGGGAPVPAGSPSSPGHPGGGVPVGTGSPSSPGHPGGGVPVPAGSPSLPGHPGGGVPVPTGSPSSPGQPGSGEPVPAGSPLSPGQPGGAPVPAGSPLSPGQPGGAPAPAGSPASSSGAPSPAGSGSGLGPAPAGDVPGSPSSSTIPGSPGSSVPGAPGSSTPGSVTPADANSPPGSLSSPPCSGSVLLMSVLSLGLGALIFSP